MKHYVISAQNRWATGGMSERRANQICAMLNNDERLPGEKYHGPYYYPKNIRDQAKPYRVVAGDFDLTKKYDDQSL